MSKLKGIAYKDYLMRLAKHDVEATGSISMTTYVSMLDEGMDAHAIEMTLRHEVMDEQSDGTGLAIESEAA